MVKRWIRAAIKKPFASGEQLGTGKGKKIPGDLARLLRKIAGAKNGAPLSLGDLPAFWVRYE